MRTDALPEIGHACGHNLIATASVAGALATAAVMEKYQLPGKVVLFGTPAEEGEDLSFHHEAFPTYLSLFHPKEKNEKKPQSPSNPLETKKNPYPSHPSKTP